MRPLPSFERFVPCWYKKYSPGFSLSTLNLRCNLFNLFDELLVLTYDLRSSITPVPTEREDEGARRVQVSDKRPAVALISIFYQPIAASSIPSNPLNLLPNSLVALMRPVLTCQSSLYTFPDLLGISIAKFWHIPQTL